MPSGSGSRSSGSSLFLTASPASKSGGIDTILLDLSESACDPTSVARVREAAPGVAVVVLCDLANEARAAEAVANGAQDYLIKDDLEPGILEHAVRYALGRKRADDELRHSEARYRSLVESLPLQRVPQGSRRPAGLRQPELSARDRPELGAVERQDRLRSVSARTWRKNTAATMPPC